MMAHAYIASSKPGIELDSYAEKCVVGDNCLVIHNHVRQVNVFSYDPKDGKRSAKTVHATVDYRDLQSAQKYIFIINYEIQISSLENHFHASGIHISEVPKLLTESPIQVIDP